MGWGIEVEADDVGSLLLELRIWARTVPFEAVRLDASPLPNPGNRHMAVAELLGQTSAGPVREWLRRRPLGRGKDFGLILCVDAVPTPRLEPITEARDAALTESSAPPGECRRRRIEALHKHAVGRTCSHRQDHPRPLHDVSPRGPAATKLRELNPLFLGEFNLIGCRKHEEIYFISHVNATSVTVH